MKFFEFFWSYFSSCLFTVIIQVYSRPIICFSPLSSYQVPFYSEKAISEIVRLSFFSQLFLWNFLNFFGHIFSCLFTVIIQVCSRPIICFFIKFISSAVLQRKKRFQKLLDLVFFRNFFFEIFWIFFSHIFLHAFSQWLFKYVRDQSYVFHH